MGKMMFVVNLVNNKVVDNLLILIVSNFHGNTLNGLRVIAVGSWSPEMLLEFLDRSGKLLCLTLIATESS